MVERRVVSGAVEVGFSWWLEVVVRMRRLGRMPFGKWEESVVVKSLIELSAGSGRDSVDGRLRPGNDVSRTLIFWFAMVAAAVG